MDRRTLRVVGFVVLGIGAIVVAFDIVSGVMMHLPVSPVISWVGGVLCMGGALALAGSGERK